MGSTDRVSATAGSFVPLLRVSKRTFSYRNAHVRTQYPAGSRTVRKRPFAKLSSCHHAWDCVVQISLFRFAVPFCVHVVEASVRRNASVLPTTTGDVTLRPFTSLMRRRSDGAFRMVATLLVGNWDGNTRHDGNRRRIFVGGTTVRSSLSDLPRSVVTSSAMDGRVGNRVRPPLCQSGLGYRGPGDHGPSTPRRPFLFVVRRLSLLPTLFCIGFAVQFSFFTNLSSSLRRLFQVMIFFGFGGRLLWRRVCHHLDCPFYFSNDVFRRINAVDAVCVSLVHFLFRSGLSSGGGVGSYSFIRSLYL